MAGETPPRERVCDRFRVQEHIGSGGFADVWRAVDEETGRDVAVKFPQLGPDATNDPERVKSQFGRAYRALSTFEGGILPTSLIRFIDGRLDSPMCLVTEFVDGEELSDAVTRPGLSPGMETVWDFGVPVVRALGFLHWNGYIYLDCKPENVLVRSEQDAPVLIDFNTAEPTDSENQTLFYQDPYKAPEQVPGAAEEQPSGPWSDVYGVGKLLVYLLTGVTMDTSETPTDGVDVREYGADPPRAVADVIRRATSADPDDRPRDCCAMMDELCEADGRDSARATLTDARTDAACPVRTGDTVGRVSEGEDLPTLSVADPEQYVSPIHLTVDRDEKGWVVSDSSLNGSFFKTPDGWQFFLGESGYRHLQGNDHPRVSDGRPPEGVRINDRSTLVPVDPSYPVQLQFDPATNGRAGSY